MAPGQRQHAARSNRRAGAAAIAAILLLAAAGHASAQPVFDSGVRRLLDRDVRQELSAEAARRPRAPLTASSLAGSFSLHSDDNGRAVAGLFVELRSPAALAQLRALGAEVGIVVADIATVRLPLDAIPQLADLPLARVSAARVLRAVHDSSMRAIRADVVRQRSASGWSGATGAGTLIGIIDTGVDLQHPDFRDESGASRVVAVWDQTLGTSPPAGFNYGFYCSTAAIDVLLRTGNPVACPTRDLNGHGTHVAGTAAGNGSASEPAFRYAGVAPLADLIIARAGDGSFPEDRVADALAWMKQEAQARGRPLVVNMSFGHQFGPHDGSLLFERVIDGLAGAGIIMVIAAGNEGMNRTASPAEAPRLIHARTTALTGATRTLEFDVSAYQPSGNRCNNVLALSAWYDTRDRLDVTLVRPNGTSVTARAGQAARIESQDAQGRITIENAYPLAAYPTTAEAYVQVDGCGTSGVPATGRWQIRLVPNPTGSASGNPIDVYLHTVSLGAVGDAYGGSGFDNRYVVGSPGNARRAITVGAFATRNCWPSGSSQMCYTSREPVGELARFSSGGPTRDGRVKPEVAAPGIGIVSALSRDRAPPGGRIAPDGAHWVMEGTSMAAPHVTGAIALLLQQRPTLTPEDVRHILEQSAYQDAFTLSTYDPADGALARDWWGFGKLDVAAALSRIGGGSVVTRVIVAPRADTLPRGATAQLRVQATDAGGDVIYPTVTFRSLDPDVATVDFAGNVRAVQTGDARLVVRADAVEDTARLTVLPPAVLAISGRSAASGPVLGRKGALVPLLALRLESRGPEAIALRALGVEVTGTDNDARLVVIVDSAGDGVPHDSARVLAGARLPVAERRTVDLLFDTLTIGKNSGRNIIIALSVSGSAPNGADFTARLVPERVRTVNALSRARDLITTADLVASAAATTTLLKAGELFALSENPVRGRSVVFNFAEIPAAAAIYTVTGGRVTDLTRRIDDVSYRWDLTNDRGEGIVPGVYLLVLRIQGQLIREKLLILARPGAAP